MDKIYKHHDTEKKWYKTWEEQGSFTPEKDPEKKPFTIIMPPPNANGSLHIGHASFLTLEDIMIRFYRMKGYSTLWLPGADHAGILTQVVFERKLEKERGVTRYHLGREKFFAQCMEFTLKNKKVMEKQMRALGASCDWSRTSFTLDPKFNKPIYQVFKKLYDDGLVFRSERMINWCTRCSTALSDLEVIHKQQKDSLYFLKYGPFVLATVRPETKFGDTAVAIHPADKRYQKWIGKTIEFETLIGKTRIKVIADKAVDPKFGTGVVKITPAHDPDDFQIGERHNLEIKQVIDFDGKLNENAGKYKGLTVKKARKIVADDLKKQGLCEKIDPSYKHAIAICERCKTVVEPMVSLQWFINMNKEQRIENKEQSKKLGVNKASLAELGILAVKRGLIKIIPKRFEKNYFIWMKNIKDWCISRQLWWGHRLPVWYCGKSGFSKLQLAMNSEINKINDKKIRDKGCGKTIVSVNTPVKCTKCGNKDLIRDPDTLDTWFSSGQWPYTTLGWYQASEKLKAKSEKLSDFDYFYPTSVMETGYEILFFWVARMIMLGLYATGKAPFKTVYLQGLVRDALGEKMSKSKENVIDPLNVIEKYGTDSLRMALVYGIGEGKDIKLSEKKIESMRNFSNKLWNIGRFIYLNQQRFKKNKIKVSQFDKHKEKQQKMEKEDKKILVQLSKLQKKVTNDIERFKFASASEFLYEFIWHKLADKYVEKSKTRLFQNDTQVLSILTYVYTTCLTLLHPFMPFVTEEIVSKIMPDKEKNLVISSWPS